MYLLFWCAWIIFNGRLTGEIASIGFLVAAIVYAFICKFMGFTWNREKRLYRSMFFFIGYALFLVKEIVVANMAVIHMITTQKEIVEPIIVRFRVNLKSETARVILANSITLTPGTITVSLRENEYVVHCLDKSLAEGMEDSKFVKMLEKWEERRDGRWN